MTIRSLPTVTCVTGLAVQAKPGNSLNPGIPDKDVDSVRLTLLAISAAPSLGTWIVVMKERLLMIGDPLTEVPAKEARVIWSCICTSWFCRTLGWAFTVKPRSWYWTVGAKDSGLEAVEAAAPDVPANKLASGVEPVGV